MKIAFVRFAAAAAAIGFCAAGAFGQCPTNSQAATPGSPVATNVSASNTIQYKWTASTAANITGYQVIVAPSNNTANATIACTGAATDNQCTGASLAIGSYSWIVRTQISGCSAIDSSPKSFTVGCVSAPSSLSPSDGTTNASLTPTLSWSNVGADSYDLFLGPVGSGCTASAVAHITNGTSFTIPSALQPGTTYEWRVAANRSSCPAAGSTCIKFTTTTCVSPASFDLLSPANGAAGVSPSPNLMWQSASGADHYVIHIGTTNPPAPQSSDPSVSATSYVVPTLAPGTYYWYVDAVAACNSNAKTHSSAVFAFNIPANNCAATTAPVLTAPANGALGVTLPVTLDWNPVTNAIGYNVYASGPTDSEPVLIGSTGTATRLITSSIPNGTVTWFVQALFQDCPPTTSAHQTFTVANGSGCPTTSSTLEAPANNATGVDTVVKFDWDPVTSAAGYRLVASINGAAANAVAITQDTELTLNVPPGAQVEWWVETLFTNCPAVPSGHFKFTAAGTTNCPATPGTPVLTSPFDGAANLSSPVNLMWSAVDGATGYRVFASLGTGGTPFLVGETSQPGLSAPLPAGTITWFVEAQFGLCPSTFSARASFTVTKGTTCNNAAPTLTAPANGATNVTSPVTFNWTNVSGAIAYKLYIALGSNTTFDLAGITTDSKLVRIVPAGAVQWYVAASFLGCPDVNSATARFTAVDAESNCPTGTITLSAPAANATVASPVAFAWTPIAGAGSYRVYAAINGGAPLLVAHVSGVSNVTVPVPSGNVEWWVEAVTGTCTPIVSAHSTFTVSKGQSCGNNAAPVLASPLSGSVPTPITFSWNATPNATEYRVFASVAGQPFVDLGTTATTHLTRDLDPGAATWYVEAFFGGCPLVTSQKASFTVTANRCDNDSPSILGPPEGASIASPVTFNWSSVTNAEHYRVYVSIDDGDFGLLAQTDDTSLTRPLPPGLVKWYVEATFDSCNSTRTTRSRFTVQRAANCPTGGAELVAPPNGSTTVTSPVLFDWNPVSGAVSYVVWIKVGNGTPTRIGETLDSQLTHAVPDGTIEWWVTSFFSGCPPLESKHDTFTVAPNACDNRRPILHQPEDGQTQLVSPVHFTWSGVPHATGYKVWAAVEGDQPSVIATTTVPNARVSVPAGTILWFVEADYDNGCPPLSSATSRFTAVKTPPPCGTPARPHISVVARALSGTAYTVRWSELANVQLYELQESTTPDFGSATTQSLTVTHAVFNHTAATTAQTYFYRVRGVSSCSDDHGAYSLVASVTIIPQTANANAQHHATVEFGTTGAIVQNVFVPGPSSPTTFSARGDKPWVTVTPASGTIGPQGMTFTVTSDPSSLRLGTNTGTIIITYGGSGKMAGNGFTTAAVPVSVTLATPVGPTGQNTPPPDALVIPAVAHAQGANNSLFESDVRIANTSATTMRYQLNFTLTQTDGTQSGQSTTIEIDPGVTMALDDIMTTFFGASTNASGVLQIRPTSSTTTGFTSSVANVQTVTTVASSRTFDTTSNGTFGQFIPAIPFSQFIGQAPQGAPKNVLSLQQISQSTSYRTNVGVLEAAGEPASVVMHVFDDTGSEVLQIPLQLMPDEQLQQGLTSFPGAGNLSLNDGRIEVEVTSPTGRVTAYASVVDNFTNDPLLVSPVLKGSDATTRVSLPGVADINNGIAAWRTDMRLFNASTAATNATLTFYPQGAPTASVSQTVTINAGQEYAINDTLHSFFGLTNTGGQVVVTMPQATSVVVTGRTFNQTTNGTYGQFIPGVTPDGSVGSGDRALEILQLEQSDRYRTNLGVAETTGNPATVEVSVIQSDSKVAPIVQIPLQANEFRQISLLDFGINTAYNARATVRVISGTGKATAYGSVIDQTTQDPTYVPAQ